MEIVASVPAHARDGTAVETSAGTPGATYSFHDLFAVRVAHRGLNELMAREFPMCRSDAARVDLTVEEGEVPVPGLRLFPQYLFDDHAFVVSGPGGRVRVEDGHLRAEASALPEHLLSAWVENVMKRRIVSRGAAFVHASAVSRDGVGLLFPAWMHTGKTDVAIRFVQHGYDYMGDDWCFVTIAGEILGYPRWLHLYDYHFESHPSLRATLSRTERLPGLERRLAVHDFVRSLDTSNPFTRALARWLTDRYYIAETVDITRAVPGSRYVPRASLTKVCLFRASKDRRIALEEVSPVELAQKTVMCGDYERRDYPWHLSAMAYAGLPNDRIDVTPAEIETLATAFRRARCYQMTIPAEPGPDELDRIRKLLEEA